MAQITAALVKELRERTGSGMMECKRALQETDGDIEAAIEHMRKSGLAKADKKAARIATEGMIAIDRSDQAVAMVEVNCETDFVSKGDAFQDFAKAVTQRARELAPSDLDELLNAVLEGEKTVDLVRKELIARIGENINVRRFTRLETDTGLLGSYSHGGRIGVVVELAGGDPALAKDIAMHVAASKPICVSADQVPEALLAKEREIFMAQAQQSGKPAKIVDKMVEGRIKKFIAEVTLLGQPFVKDPSQSVENLLAAAGATALRFERYELGEGIDKKIDDFVAEVMAQARGD
jgi:elongation factor Ts